MRRCDRRFSGAALIVGIAAALMASPTMSAPRRPRPLIVEAVGVDAWRADARGMWIEFKLDRPRTSRLSIGFAGPQGDAVTPPAARQVTLTSPAGDKTAFAASGPLWISTTNSGPLQDGSYLSIIEADHRHDFFLNVHEPAPPHATEPQR